MSTDCCRFRQHQTDHACACFAQERERQLMGPTRNVEAQRRAFRAAGTRALEAQPACLRNGALPWHPSICMVV